MMNGQWFEEIFLYNESFSSLFKSFVSAKRFPLLFLTNTCEKSLMFSKTYCSFSSGVYREDLSMSCLHYSEKYVWLHNSFYLQFQS